MYFIYIKCKIILTENSNNYFRVNLNTAQKLEVNKGVRNVFLPKKKSIGWLYVLTCVFIINICSLLVTRVILGSEINTKNAAGFVVLALIASIAACFGYFGKKAFSYLFILFNLIGILYMFYIAIMGKSSGWADLTSIVGFMFMSCMGILLGILTEIILRARRSKL